MGSGFPKVVILLAALASSAEVAAAGECPGNPNALGTSRTIVVDPREHGRIGTMDYAETLPLVDREVVLTFDDGPIPPYTTRVLEILAAECVKATYFIVGDMAKEYPALVRRAFNEGHTIGTHSMSHPLRFRAQPVERGNAQIDDGIAATAAALGAPEKVAPFFRFPGFGHTPPAHQHAAERGLQVWGADVPADDWKKIGGREVAKRAIQRLEAKGKGILLLHDIHSRTVEALPIILHELKARGFRVVHVVPSSAEQPPTLTAAADWLPGSRRVPVPPVILLASVQEPDAEMLKRLMKKDDAELCALGKPGRETARMAARKRGHDAHVTHVAKAQDRSTDGSGAQGGVAHKTAHASSVHPKTVPAKAEPGKTGQAKAPAKVANAEPPKAVFRNPHNVQ